MWLCLFLSWNTLCSRVQITGQPDEWQCELTRDGLIMIATSGADRRYHDWRLGLVTDFMYVYMIYYISYDDEVPS